jgi:3-deoxy-D-manno-octulosonic-acid transferase
VILAIYSALLAAVLVVGAPWWLARMATSGRYRAGLPGRLGVVPRRLREAVRGRRVVWLHAVSVGEVMAASELVRELRRALPEWVIGISTTTETGQRLAGERFGKVLPDGAPASLVFYLPLDFKFVIRRYMRVLHPTLLILMESELWPNLMEVCAEQDVRVAVVNARVSDRSLPRYLRLRRLWRPLLERVSLFLAQSEENAQRLKRIGAPAERVRVTGNLKYDVKAAGESAMTKMIAERLPSGAKVLVAGSTLEGEEKMLLEAWPRGLEMAPGAVMVLAPRRPERFAAVAALVNERGFGVVRASELRAGAGEIVPGGVVLLDTIGDLASVYSLGTVAFVGGSLVAAGGHNPLEPARFGVPVVMGESSENFREIVEAMLAADGIRIVSAGELAGALASLMRDDDEARAVGERGREVFDAQAGATGRTVKALLGLLRDAGASGAQA